MEEIRDKKSYEISFLAKNEGDVEQVLKTLKSAGGEITSEGPIAKINLAYPIKKQHSAYFGYFHFSAEPTGLEQLKNDLNINPAVLRFLIITPPLIRDKAKPFVAAKRRLPSTPLVTEKRPPLPLSNEALEKQLKEILQ